MPWKKSLPVSVVVLAAGCAPYDIAFEPHPAEVMVAGPGADAEPVRVLVSIQDVGRTGGKGPDRPAALDVRLRIENTSPFTVSFDPGSLVLVSGDLVRFPDPVVEPGRTVEVEAGGDAIVDASFTFPGNGRPEGTDLGGLNLRWTLLIDGRPVTAGASFVQRLPEEYDYPAHGVGVGYQRYP